MTPHEFQRADAIFQAACLLPAGERTGYVLGQCADDQALARLVMSMLHHDERASVVFDAPLLGVGGLAREFLEDEPYVAPERVGPFRVIREIGRGGFGVVYLGEQERPLRTVAIKVLKPSVTSAEALRRFEHEAAVLARLRHPAIAQIIQAGVAVDGGRRQLYFAMEYVRGSSLSEYIHGCDHGRPIDLRRRLEVLVLICDGVEHAHQNGVIHRDLKPDNILVGDDGQPRILDFGVARVLDAEAAVTMQTSVGQLVGTLAYMSPEQVSGDPARVDTRTDVYALGVILYQCLCDRLPIDVSGRSLADAARLIQDASPAPLEVEDRRLSDDLAAIVGKALRKEPEGRYASASLFAADLRAVLEDRPVTASNPTVLYELRKLAKRHRRLVIAGAVTLGALGVSAVGTVVQAVRATREADRASVQARKLDRFNQFLQDMLASAEPNRARGEPISVVAMLDATARRIEGELGDEPDLRASVLQTLGETYANLGSYEQAERSLRAALATRRSLLGEADLDTATTEQSLARVLRDTARFDEALELCRLAMGTRERLAGRDSVAFARTLVLHADLLRFTSGDYAQAEASYRQAIALFDRHDGPRGRQAAAALGNLGAMHLDLFRYDAAESSLRDAFQIARKVYGVDHSVSILNANNYGSLLADRGKLTEAREVCEPALASAQRIFGPDHAETARVEAMLAQVLFDLGEAQEAEPLARHALLVRRAALPQHHRLTVYSSVLLADILSRSDDAPSRSEAESLARSAIAFYRSQNGERYWPCAEATSVLCVCDARTNPDQARAALETSIETIRLGQGKRSRAVRAALRRLEFAYDLWGRTEEAAKAREELELMDSK